MELAQVIHLGAMITGIAIALWARWFALVMVAPLVFGVSGVALWLHGYPALTAAGSAAIDVVLLQLAFFLASFVTTRLSTRRRNPLTGQEQSMLDRTKLPVM